MLDYIKFSNQAATKRTVAFGTFCIDTGVQGVRPPAISAVDVFNGQYRPRTFETEDLRIKVVGHYINPRKINISGIMSKTLLTYARKKHRTAELIDLNLDGEPHKCSVESFVAGVNGRGLYSLTFSVAESFPGYRCFV